MDAIKGYSAMKAILLLLIVSTTIFAEDCPIPGKAEHWIIDYCLWVNESDDLEQPGVQECYEEEKQQSSDKKECKAKEYFKRKICEAHAFYEEGFDVDDCVADEEFKGPTVSNGGFKKPVVKSYLP
ncbi:MAG: hypothetical protein JXA04_10085 [Gammaproteobacteria bacterium]|nr:hypothetical protein [Gammaproteobacteria bacterium]